MLSREVMLLNGDCDGTLNSFFNFFLKTDQ